MSEIDKDKLMQLFSQYEGNDSKVDECKREMDRAIKDRSDTVELILAANNGKKKIRRNGKEMSIVVRGNTHFFRGAKDNEDITDL